VQKRNNNCLLDGTEKGNSLLSHKVNCGKSFKVGLKKVCQDDENDTLQHLRKREIETDKGKGGEGEREKARW